MPKVVNTQTQTTTKQSTEPDGTVVEVITKQVTDTYADGSTSTRTETKTIRKSAGGSSGGSGGKGGAQIIDVNLTPETSKAPKVANTTNTDFIKDCLEAHNRLRAKHGGGPLELDAELGKIAQAWAIEIAKKGKMQHSTYGFGENIYWNTDDPPGRRPAEAWYSEIKDFNFNKMEPQSGTGHFTQLIWKSSKKVGIAMEKGKNGYYVVANYFPNGNIMGRFAENIEKAK